MESLISANAIWLLDAIADGITVQEPSGRLIYANPAAARAAGFDSPGELLAAGPGGITDKFELLDEYGGTVPADQLPGRIALTGATENERLLQFRVRATGEKRWSMVKAQPVLNPDGSVRIAINIWHDVTEQLQRQEALEHASAQLEELTAELEATVSELEARTSEAELRAERQRFLAEAGRMLGGSLDTEDTLRMIVHLAVPRLADFAMISLVDAEGMLQQIEVAHADPERVRFVKELRAKYPPQPTAERGEYAVLRTGEPQLLPDIPPELLEQVAQDEEHLELLHNLNLRSAMLVPMKVREEVLGVITFVRAETISNYNEEDLQFAESLASRAGLALSNARLYRDAQEANRSKADFLAVMSHELRTPLTAVFGYTELLATGVAGEVTDFQRGHLDRIHASAAHLLSIIEEILNYARAEAGHEEVHSEDVKLSDVVAEAVILVKPNAEKKRLALNTIIDDDGIMRTDRAKLRQILVNLLSNAVKFTDGGYVNVQAGFAHPHQVRIEVEDTGIGIDPADFEKIFEPFRQLQPSMTRNTGGTGLGLAVSRRFVELLGGRIEVASTPGAGSRFIVVLPAKSV